MPLLYFQQNTDAGAIDDAIVAQLLNIGDELPTLQADEGKIESVITNLINNAIKFTPEHGDVAVCVEVANGEMGMRVSDTGMGFSIVSKIVTMHNGRFEVESEMNQGTTFTVFLP